MTMQIAIVAKDGLVLASDTKYRPIERHQSDASIPSGLFNAPKIFLCEHHSIAVAFAGWTDDVFLAGEELAGHLDAIPIVNDQNIRDVLVTWGNSYYEKMRPGFLQAAGLLLQLLVVRPSEQYPILKLYVSDQSRTRISTSYMVNGHETNTTIFWPEYARAADDDKPDLSAAISIAAITILMGAEINDHGIGGLEIWQYTNGWKRVPDDEIEALRTRFDHLQSVIAKTILPNSKRGQSAQQPSRE